MGKFTGNTEACPNCQSLGRDTAGDNLSIYEDGSKHCHACGYDFQPKNKAAVTKEVNIIEENCQLMTGSYQDIPDRKITKETCEFFKYEVMTDSRGQEIHIENYPEGDQKLRYLPKQFINKKKTNNQFFAQNLWIPTKELSIVIDEGVFDCMSIAQITKFKQPVVSIRDGINSLQQQLDDNKEWLEGFKDIILCVDNDDAAKKVLKEIKGLYRICHLPLKDANDMLKAGLEQELLHCLDVADYIQPDGLVFGSQVNFNEIWVPEKPGYETPYKQLNDFLGGYREGRLYMLGAGTGAGKSTYHKELVLHWAKNTNLKIATLFLEEQQKTTLQSLIAMDNDLHPDEFAKHPEKIDKLKIEASIKYLSSDRIAYPTKRFNLGSDELFNYLDYLTIAKKFDIIILDHISIVVESSDITGQGERKDIDRLVYKLRELINRTGCTVLAIVHLSESGEHKGFEEGKKPRMKDFRGSRALAQVPDVCMALVRDMKKYEVEVEILKNRINGKIGSAGKLFFQLNSGRYKSIEQLMGK